MPESIADKKKRRMRIIINGVWCKKCGICVAYCPKGVFVADDLGAPVITAAEKCINCGLCVLRCPDFAIKLEEDGVLGQSGAGAAETPPGSA